MNRIGVANNAAGTLKSYRYGNAGRNVLTGPRIVDVDASAIKTWSFSESRRLEFRAEFFNLPNHPIFSNPDTTNTQGPGAPTFGQLTSTRIDPRDVQLALKIVF